MLDCINQARRQPPSPAEARAYREAEGYPHLVVDDFLTSEAAENAWREFPAIDNAQWIHYLHYNEKKFGLNKISAIPPAARRVIEQLNSPEFLAYLSDLTGIPGLIGDPELEGGGLHQIPAGGFLNIHADFTAHPHHRNWQRRVNLLIYLNKDWQDSYGGQLELWSPDLTRMVRRVAPVFNRCVIFNTNADSFHGHPDPLACPPGMSRKSIALYYFTEEASAPSRRATNYRARPGDGVGKSALIFLDRTILAVYNRLKGWLGINDDVASAVLGWLSRRRR